MKIIRLYADAKGESHFEDVEIQFEAPTKSGRVSARLPATGIIFREVPTDYDLDWHLEIQFEEPTKSGRVSARLPATGIIFREVPTDYDLDWHPAPRRQYIINLDAGVQLTASDGETRRVKAGEVVLVEDTWGKGHLSKALEAKIRHCIFVPID